MPANYSSKRSLAWRPLTLVIFAALIAVPARAQQKAAREDPLEKLVFAEVNGQKITYRDYVQALERQQVAVPGGQSTNAERIVIDQLVGNKIILDEASKSGALPTEADVNAYYEFRKKLFEQQFPGKTFEEAMKENGSTPEELKTEFRTQLAETNVYVKRLKVSEDEIRKAYDSFKGQYLPARVQLRMILAQPNSAEFSQAKKLLGEKKPFEEVAKEVNLVPNLKATGGLLPQAQPVTALPMEIQPQVENTEEGSILGPVEFTIRPSTPAVMAWIKVEKKLPGFVVPYIEARPEVARRVVQQKLVAPENARVRDEIMKLKLNAAFVPTHPDHKQVWEGIQRQARDAGVGQASAPIPPP